VLVSDAGDVVRVKNADRFSELPLLFGKGAPARAVDLLRLVGVEPKLASRMTGARLVGERRWDVYLDGRIEVRLPEDAPDAAWQRLAREQRTSGVLGRAITGVDLRHPDWLTVRLADELLQPEREPGA
jgi:cell division protein FtsQ